MSLPEPPKWAVRFLQWYCKPQFLEEIEGDIYELFDRRVETEGLKSARRKFGWDVFRFFRWSNIQRSNSNKMNQLGLFRNYLKLGFRSIQRNVLISAINIFGLAIAIGVGLTTYIFVDLQLNFDQFHTHKDRIYQIVNEVDDEGEDRIWGDSPVTLGPDLLKDHPSVEAFTRIEYVRGNVRYKDKVLDELMAFVDDAYLDIFDFALQDGDVNALKNNDQIVLSYDVARKYFGDVSAIGKDLEIKFGNNRIKRYTVGAVLQDYPYNAGLRLGIHLPFNEIYDLGFRERKHALGSLIDATFIMMREGQDIRSISASFDSYREAYNGSDPEWEILSFIPMGLTDIPMKGYEIYSSVIPSSHPAGKVALSIIALFLLSMACFNFMNISITGVSKRLKEIGLRKVMGGVRKQIIYQFLVENLIQTMFALAVGTLISYFLFTPGFDMLIPELDIQFRAHDWQDMVTFYVTLLVVVGLVSGAYPAIYVSRFEPISILRGTNKLKGKNLFSKILLGFQFFMAFATIVACFVFTDQSIHLKNKAWGYNPENILFVSVRDQATFERLRNDFIHHEDVRALSGSTGQVGWANPKQSFDYLDHQFSIRVYEVTEGYSEVMGFKLKSGRFLTDREQDQQSGIMVNATFVKRMNWQQPIGQSVVHDGTKLTVVGVLEDFYHSDFFNALDPVMIRGLREPADVRYFSMKVAEGKLLDIDSQLMALWKEVNPNDMYRRQFQTDVFDDFYQETDANISIVIVLSTVAIILACLGLYGLISFHIQAKLKEFSVRKVLGAAPKAIASIASKQYSWVILISFAIGAPIGAMGILELIKDVFSEPKPVSAAPFIVALFMIVVTLALTVTGQVLKAIKVNPATILRSE
ncbi:MAG: ABC transporter permease [Cytophagales bacterium]|nr:ABC transporter permease [Cytophagales bacterium]